MLAKTAYDQSYIDAAHAKVTALLDDLDAVLAAGGPRAAVLEPRLTEHLVLALDAYFMHRARGAEGKDGNPLNEVRLLARSILENDGELVADKTIKWTPASTVLGYAVGDAITLSAGDLRRLSHAYFAEITLRFT